MSYSSTNFFPRSRTQMIRYESWVGHCLAMGVPFCTAEATWLLAQSFVEAGYTQEDKDNGELRWLLERVRSERDEYLAKLNGQIKIASYALKDREEFQKKIIDMSVALRECEMGWRERVGNENSLPQ